MQCGKTELIVFNGPNALQPHLYHNVRHLNPTVCDLGRQILYNWIVKFINRLSFKWFNRNDLSDTYIRTNLKNYFYYEF